MSNFKIEIEQLIPWSVALDLARETAGKGPAFKEPSDLFKNDIINSEHSPLRAVTYKVRMIGIPYWVSVHLVRHKYGVEHFVSTQRTDRTGVPRDKKPQDEPVNHTMLINAQEILFVSRRRLCAKASPETREVWKAVVDSLYDVDQTLALHCAPMCLYRGGCFEKDGCGYFTNNARAIAFACRDLIAAIENKGDLPLIDAVKAAQEALVNSAYGELK